MDGEHPRTMRPVTRRDEADLRIGVTEFHEPIAQRRDVTGDVRHAQLEKQFDTGVHPGKVGKGQRDHLEAACVVEPHRIIGQHVVQVVGTACGHPAHVRGLELGDQLAAHVREGRTPRRLQPLLRATRQNVDRCLRHVERQRTDALNGVDHEVDAAIATGAADRGDVESCPTAERHPAHRDHFHIRSRRDGLEQRRLIRHLVHAWQPHDGGAAALRALDPRKDVGGKFAIHGQNLVTRC